jgi:hypothetical protein
MRDIVRDAMRDRGLVSPRLNLKIAKMAQDIFLQDAQAVSHVLRDIALNEEAKDSDRIAAVKEIHDRAYGKSVSKHEMNITNESNGISAEAISNLPDDALQRMIEDLTRIADQGDVVDVTPENESAEHVPNDQPVKRRNRSKA